MSIQVIIVFWLLSSIPITLFIGKLIRYSDERYEQAVRRVNRFDSENLFSVPDCAE